MIRRVTVLGAGTMGHGIAHAAIAAGYDTRLCDVSSAALEHARTSIEGIVRKGIDLGKLTVSEADAMLRRLVTADRLPEALDRTDFVIEAAPERIDLKLALLADVDTLVPAEAVIATNTSALSITELADSTRSPSRVGGMHFSNPVHKMKLVEIVRALDTAPAALDTIGSPGAWARRRSSFANPRASSRRASTRPSGTKRSTC
jgi:3-hydroxybutyryl-CoA dehydrogenase